MCQRVINGVTAAVDAAVGLGTEPMRLSDKFSEGGDGNILIGGALDKHPFVGGAVLPTGSPRVALF
jgi:hypothetical protein